MQRSARAKLSVHPAKYIMAACAVGLQLIGFGVIKKIVAIEA